MKSDGQQPRQTYTIFCIIWNFNSQKENKDCG